MILKVLLIYFAFQLVECTEDDIKVFTVATEKNDGFERYIRSASYYDIQVEVLGQNIKWEGGSMAGAGGGQKVNLLKAALEPYKNDAEKIILFTDSYDVVFGTGLREIVKKFKKTGAKILFSAEHYCWPDDSLRSSYPVVPVHAYRFLNSGMFIGYTSSLYSILQKPIKNSDDDQLYYTNIFLDSDLRSKYGIQLDQKAEIFQNLNGALSDVKLDILLDSAEGTLINVNFGTYPSIIHGNGPSKIYLNSFANYLAGTFKDSKCVICEENKIELKESSLPLVSIAVFVEKPVPFFEEFLEKVLAIDYPKDHIHFFLHNNVDFHEAVAKNFVKRYGGEYKSTKFISKTDKIDEKHARKLSIQQAELKESDYLLSIDADAHIDKPNILRDLISYNRSFIAPVLARPNELWSNFWGALNEGGYYARSHDYVDIVKGNIRGIWNMPYVTSCFLVNKKIFPKMKFNHVSFDPDMAMCENLRNEGVFMYIVNVEFYGHLVSSDEFITEYTRPDFYMLLSNRFDWEKRYLHPEYRQLLKPNATFMQPCPDVYWIPIVTEKFCEDLIAIMEGYGKWSAGKNDDDRLEGGYEAVPTRDIHMNQVGLEALWLRFLKLYVRPLQEAVFTGYYHNPPRSLMNFVVRYRPDEQPFLRPHHDSSTYTINVALNRAGIDYEGGGCRFIRYNCSVTDTKMGWMLLHPGRLTHFHEGLRVTKGTRYIAISFVDP